MNMKLSLVVFLLLLQAESALSSTNETNAKCEKVSDLCLGQFMVHVCTDSCQHGWTEVPNCDFPTTPPPLSGAIGTFAPSPNVTATTIPTTLPTKMNITIVTTSPLVSPSSSPIPRFFCRECPQNCATCNYSAEDIRCEVCVHSHVLEKDSRRCVEPTDPTDDTNLVPIVVGSVCGVVVIVVLVVGIVCLVQRSKQKQENVTGQCHVCVVTSDQLSEGKPTSYNPRSTTSVISETGELDKLPAAPPPPEGYDVMQRGSGEEQLDYTPLSLNNPQHVSSELTLPSQEENIYMNTSFHAAKPQEANSSTAPSRPPKIGHQQTESNSMEVDSIYQNTPYNVGQNNTEAASLEMDEIYINEGADDVRPMNQSSTPSWNQGMVDQEPAALQQDDIYCNDEDQMPQEVDQVYEVPVEDMRSHDSNVYMESDTNSVYQNLNVN